MTKQQHIGLLGGTFDPIHLGHLHIALAAQQALTLDQVELIPCYLPAHRARPIASEHDRKIMIELAIADHPTLRLNTLELQRRGISYTIDTLKARSQPHQTLYWLVGYDAFLQFHTWHEWHHILHYCHLVVINRPDYPSQLPAPLATFVAKHQVTQREQLQQHTHGKLYMLNIEPCAVSATAIRATLQQGKVPQEALPSSVAHYLTQHSLYDASS